VKRLVITAVIYDTTEVEEILESGTRRETTHSGPIVQQTFAKCSSDELAQINSDLAWLTTQRAQQANDSDSVLDRLTAAMTTLARLQSLKLDATVMRAPGVSADTFQGDVREIWAQASRVFLLTTTAITRSGIAIDSLDLYRKTPRCGVFVKDLSTLSGSWGTSSLPSAFATVKTLAITVGLDFDVNREPNAATREESRGNDGGQTPADRSSEYPALANFLTAMPNLENIDLHIYRTGLGDVDALRMTLQAFAKQTYLQSLQRCSLAGVFVDEESLRQFLHRHSSTRELELVEIRLGEHGNWGTVLSSIKADLKELQSLRLSSLWASRLMNLEPVWESTVLKEKLREWSFPYGGGRRMVHTLELDGEDLQREWEFRGPPGGRPLGSPQSYRWRLMRSAAYGPP
jgi:hypothetical protein